MKSKQWLLGLLVLAMITLVSLLALANSSPSSESQAPQSASEQNILQVLTLGESQVLNVYYFHGNVRCASCKRIEQLTTDALQQGYAEQLAQGKVVLHTINVEAPEHNHYIRDFELITRSVVLELTDNGQQTSWRRLDRVWQLFSKPAAFNEYMFQEIAGISQEQTHG